jgi:hypothetical protein
MAAKGKLRERIESAVTRMRGAPRHVAIPTGVALVLGGTILAPLPVFGIWMAPLGLAILAPHWPGAARLAEKLRWQQLRLLRWSIRYGFVRVKRRTRTQDD